MAQDRGMTRGQAMDRAVELGLVGVHRMNDGSFMPGSSHEEYVALLDNMKAKGAIGQSAGGPDQENSERKNY